MARQKPKAEKVSIDGFVMSLTEFCTQLSATERRVELIGAFEHIEKLAGNMKDTKESYTARFKAFCNKPM